MRLAIVSCLNGDYGRCRKKLRQNAGRGDLRRVITNNRMFVLKQQNEAALQGRLVPAKFCVDALSCLPIYAVRHCLCDAGCFGPRIRRHIPLQV